MAGKGRLAYVTDGMGGIGAAISRRLGEPGEIASIVAWLASDEAGFATEADCSLNGGLQMS
jgi:acetoacetyl-CoA reductase